MALAVLGGCSCSGARPPLDAATIGAGPSVSAAQCLRSSPGDLDADADGLDDACERDLVRAFAPLLVAAPTRCVASAGLPPGGYFYGAAPVDDGVRLVYLPAYFIDCGWSGFKCHLPRVDCSPHVGDSEFIALDVVPDGASWRVAGVFLSAHCFAGSAPDCRWYRGSELDAFEWKGSAPATVPVVWVAEGRNANYPSRSSCDGAHYSLDTCDHNRIVRRFPVADGRDIGSRSAPIRAGAASPGCVGAGALSDPGARPDTVECFWSAVPFRGWQGRGEGATPYDVYLTRVAEL